MDFIYDRLDNDSYEALSTLDRILDSSESPEQFSIECTLNGIADLSTKKFFDDKIFPFLFSSSNFHGRDLKLKLKFKKNLAKLDKFYQSQLENL